MNMLAEARRLLASHGIRDAECFAEILVAEAIGGVRVKSGVNRGFDVRAPMYNRVEVKCRQLPLDGRTEERVAFEDSKAEGFDFAAIVIFEPDFDVKGAVLVPYASIWPVVRAHRYGRIGFGRAQRLEGSVDITTEVRDAAAR
ncbi:MAG: hypothetical protein KF768_04865 [Phycisphaeraceae bacterium]|nr:hypothetical protein [Phycisphaeraceae bacterium]